jgi:hypothetical protein
LCVDWVGGVESLLRRGAQFRQLKKRLRKENQADMLGNPVDAPDPKLE